MKYKHTVGLLFTGIVSGFISALLVVNILYQYIDLADVYIAGIVFGIIVALYHLAFKLQTIPWNILLWMLFSAAAFFFAVWVSINTIHLMDRYEGLKHLNFFIGGVAGAAIMISGYSFFLSKISIKAFTPLIVLGGVLGFIGAFAGLDTEVPNAANFYVALYPIWQGGMAAALGFMLDRKLKKNPSPNTEHIYAVKK